MFGRVISILAVASSSLGLHDASLDYSTMEMQANRLTEESSAMIHGLESDLVKLHSHLHLATPKSFLQLLDAPKSQVKKLDPAEAMKQMNGLVQAGPKQFPAMAMLMHGMYDSWKEKIADANKYEEAQKSDVEKTISELEMKKTKELAGVADKATQKQVAETYDRMERYWKKQRAISHRQYHTSLKILHSGMQKFKGVMGALEDAGQGKKPSKKDLQAIGVMPEIAFLQLQAKLTDISEWASASTKELASA